MYVRVCVCAAHIYVFWNTVGLHGRQQLHDGDNLQAQHWNDVVALNTEEMRKLLFDF